MRNKVITEATEAEMIAEIQALPIGAIITVIQRDGKISQYERVEAPKSYLFKLCWKSLQMSDYAVSSESIYNAGRYGTIVASKI